MANPPAANFCFDCGAPFAPAPFRALLVVEKGLAQGMTFPLPHAENTVGASAAHVELADDRFVAPRTALLVFDKDRLVLEDQGSANGVFVKLREQAAIAPGDHFVAGERLLRYDGPIELPRDGQRETPYLGAARPRGEALRVTEVLAGGRTGRTCLRAGSIAIGRAGCDMSFPADPLLGPRHAEVRGGQGGAATLVDLGASASGVFLRLRPQERRELRAGDVLLIGERQLRLET